MASVVCVQPRVVSAAGEQHHRATSFASLLLDLCVSLLVWQGCRVLDTQGQKIDVLSKSYVDLIRGGATAAWLQGPIVCCGDRRRPGRVVRCPGPGSPSVLHLLFALVHACSSPVSQLAATGETAWRPPPGAAQLASASSYALGLLARTSGMTYCASFKCR